MKTLYKIKKALIFAFAPILLLTLVTACGDSDNGTIEPPADDLNIVEVAQSDNNFSILVDLVVEAGLVDDLSGGELTVFAPTNAAFEALFEVVDPADLTQEDLIEILTYHVTQGAIPASALSPTQDVEMLNGEVTLVRASAAGVDVNGSSNVVSADIAASNGIIHAVDEVLLPREFRVAVNGPSLIDVAAEAGNFETLLALAEQTGFTSTLTHLGPYTAFAPTDEAFDTLFESVNPNDLTTEQVTFILTYHVLIGGPIFAADLEEQQAPTAANEEVLYVVSNEEGVTINGSASVTTPDVEAANGVIHIIDEVLLPNPFVPVTGIVSRNYDLTTLLSLVVERPEILATLSDAEGDFTLFAPTNEAFEEALAAFPDLTEEEITEILLYHVLGASVFSGDLEDGQTAETLQGEEITVSLNGGVEINSSAVINADLGGSNGVVHIIDAVLVPPSFLE
jgi:transforming growth factor-beta-induced protein